MGYWNCRSMLTIYRGISCRLIIFLSRIGNKHGFFSYKNSISHGCEAVVLPICVIFIKKIWKLNFRVLATIFMWSFFHLPVLKKLWLFANKRKLGDSCLFATFLVAIFYSAKISETHWSKTAGVFVSILWIKLILVSWSFVCKFLF